MLAKNFGLYSNPIQCGILDEVVQSVFWFEFVEYVEKARKHFRRATSMKVRTLLDIMGMTTMPVPWLCPGDDQQHF